MSNLIEIKNDPYEDIEVIRWGAFIEFVAQAKEETLSSIQRIAYISYWYSSELLNGGHHQYIYNLERFKHDEIVNALEVIGATCQCNVLLKVMELYNFAKIEMPTDYNEYISWNEEFGYDNKIFEFDQQFYECRPEIETELLGVFLKQNEDKFIKWI